MLGDRGGRWFRLFFCGYVSPGISDFGRGALIPLAIQYWIAFFACFCGFYSPEQSDIEGKLLIDEEAN